MPHVTCEIARWTADAFPGWVEARIIDVEGTRWAFTDKLPIFSAEPLTSASSFPVAGAIRCVVVEEDVAAGRTLIDTSLPDGVTAIDGVSTHSGWSPTP